MNQLLTLPALLEKQCVNYMTRSSDESLCPAVRGNTQISDASKNRLLLLLLDNVLKKYQVLMRGFLLRFLQRQIIME